MELIKLLPFEEAKPELTRGAKYVINSKYRAVFSARFMQNGSHVFFMDQDGHVVEDVTHVYVPIPAQDMTLVWGPSCMLSDDNKCRVEDLMVLICGNNAHVRSKLGELLDAVNALADGSKVDIPEILRTPPKQGENFSKILDRHHARLNIAEASLADLTRSLAQQYEQLSEWITALDKEHTKARKDLETKVHGLSMALDVAGTHIQELRPKSVARGDHPAQSSARGVWIEEVNQIDPEAYKQVRDRMAELTEGYGGGVTRRVWPVYPSSKMATGAYIKTRQSVSSAKRHALAAYNKVLLLSLGSKRARSLKPENRLQYIASLKEFAEIL